MKINTKIVGVTYNNDNGVNRQEIIKGITIDTKIFLQFDKNNQYDKNAIQVILENGFQLGYLNKEIAKQISEENQSLDNIKVGISGITGGGKAAYGINIFIENSNTKQGDLLMNKGNNDLQICKKCNTSNLHDASFCVDCGNQLLIECIECKKVNSTVEKFCPKCGTSLEIYKKLKTISERIDKQINNKEWNNILRESNNMPESSTVNGNISIKLHNEIYNQIKSANNNIEEIQRLKKEIEIYKNEDNDKKVISLIDNLLIIENNKEYLALKQRCIQNQERLLEEQKTEAEKEMLEKIKDSDKEVREIILRQENIKKKRKENRVLALKTFLIFVFLLLASLVIHIVVTVINTNNHYK